MYNNPPLASIHLIIYGARNLNFNTYKYVHMPKYRRRASQWLFIIIILQVFNIINTYHKPNKEHYNIENMFKCFENDFFHFETLS